MPEKYDRKQRLRFPHEQRWLNEFAGFHGTNGITQFSEGALRCVSLTQVIQALACGRVIFAEKCDGPGTICEVAYYAEDRLWVLVTVHFISNEERLTILSAERKGEFDSEPDHAA